MPTFLGIILDISGLGGFERYISSTAERIVTCYKNTG